MHSSTLQSLILAAIAAILLLVAASHAERAHPGSAGDTCEAMVCSEAGPDFDPDG